MSYGGEIRCLAGLGPWLLHTQGPVSIQDVRTGAWKSYHELKSHGAPLWVGGGATAVTTDATGFWIDAGTTICHLDPASGQLTDELPVANPTAFRRGNDVADAVAGLARQRAALRPEAATLAPWQAAGVLPGAVMEVLPDGEFLWISSQTIGERNAARLQLWHAPSRRWVGQVSLYRLPVMAADDKYFWFCYNEYGTPAKLHRVEKRLLYARPDKAALVAPGETEARAAYEKLSFRDRAFASFARGRYAEAAALFAQVPPERVRDLQVEPGPEALFMQALCYDAQGLAEPARQRAFLDDLLKQFPQTALAEEARRELTALAAKPEVP